MRPTEPTDDELVTRILAGDQEAASRLLSWPPVTPEKPEYADRLIRLFANVDDRSLGPDSDGSRPTRGSYVKADALIAMGRCGGPAARTFLLQQLKEGDDYCGYRARAATGLLELGDPTVIPELQQALLDPDTDNSSRGFIKKAIEGLTQ